MKIITNELPQIRNEIKSPPNLANLAQITSNKELDLDHSHYNEHIEHNGKKNLLN